MISPSFLQSAGAAVTAGQDKGLSSLIWLALLLLLRNLCSPVWQCNSLLLSRAWTPVVLLAPSISPYRAPTPSCSAARAPSVQTH